MFTDNLTAQDTTATKKAAPTEASHKKWYEALQIRGYTQVRYNRLLETNPDLKCEQCDRSWGDNNGISFRRVRIILFGNVHERVYVYIQPDFASSASSTSLNFGQLRDAYFDLSLDKNKEYRFRLGQSKVPYGFENLQSSQNRLPLDRADATNSATPNERDFSAIFYWAPKKIRDRFSTLVSSGLKGTGDYGMFGFGVYNGQTTNRPEANNNLHVVSRLSYPFQLKNGQMFEAGIQAYAGKVVIPNLSKDVKSINENYEYADKRVAASFALYPQPFGFSAEYNVGTGPEYNPVTNTIEQKRLHGGYVQAEYMLKINKQLITPFTRYQYYHGGKKQELDARKYLVKELELGIEWQVYKNFELTAMYTISDRTFEDGANPLNHQKGNLLRLQAQFNY